jgi:hypothetical protein
MPGAIPRRTRRRHLTESIRKDKGTDSLEESQAADYLVEARVKMEEAACRPASISPSRSSVQRSDTSDQRIQTWLHLSRTLRLFTASVVNLALQRNSIDER